ncbi:DUF6447 family protein [Paracoccaceae bacterium]|nr:DUF6447 family protein [Paracoccaceae bacterium]MED7677140.1 hypothetical protein [Rhodobacteraceae bacterium IMCC15231]
MQNITIDGEEFDLSKASLEAQTQLKNLQFVDEQILQRNNELQIAQTARMGYSRALKRELEKIED